MSFRSFAFIALSCAATAMVACGGNVSVGNGGGGDAGNAGSAGAGAGGGSTTSTSTGTTSTTTGTTSTTGTTGCEGLDHIACLGAFSKCVPVYDDQCCPSCDPMGGCADCSNIVFHHCSPLNDYCAGTPPPPGSCGFVPEWACQGGQADCSNVEGGASKIPCATVAGCIPAYCNEAADCPFAYECHAATAGSCVTQCDSVPPPCPGGTWPESDGFCYTGYCIPENLCVIGL